MGKRKGSVSRNAVIEFNGETRESPSQIALGVKHKRRKAVPKIANADIDKFVEERLSELPDEILSSIISAIPVREAARSRILSSRWRYLRPFFHPNLRLDAYSMHGHNYGNDEKYPARRIERGERKKRMCRFVRSVNQFLQFHAAHTIKTFGICFYLNKEYSNDLDQWINYAITAGAEKLQLDLTYLNGYDPDDKCYNFPFRFLRCSKESSLKHLELVFCILRYQDFEGFSSLTTLTLRYVMVVDGDIVNLLSKCPHLEWLSIERCEHLVNLKIVGPSLQLKYLKVELPNYCELMKIEIHAENLRTFEYWGREIIFSIRRVPRLVNVLVSFRGIAIISDGMISPFSRLPSHLLHQIEFLVLTTFTEVFNPEVVPLTISRLTNLKHLILQVFHEKEDLLRLTSILKGCPLLQKFHVLMFNSRTRAYKAPGKILRPPVCPHNHLKEAEISYFYGKKAEVELAVYILKNAMSLESMTIDPRPKHYLGDGRWEIMKWPDSVIWFTKIRARVVKLLNQEVPQSVKLVIL
ncbi:F-box/FBD/LRR-repeat protein At5g56420-like [Tasmannia lanceolata]|uniref:F-box/FBD/LRR-repeat protein At5g56420-like n=1 Tax=Tasmannia lanceolata TaxID=3420 RepID=UPI00406461E1